ncbi:hypothetical protein IC620_05625 [Hazenella sp. IB182357]|uniref:BclA C-terminal domain-containing protein n=1 Tax=Polycladospora coralii TaxID=2771432 RepID=A0A926RTW2_9BACL|nr:hypothetical protein [Polycladospora coralii]MBD1371837.1 hypothetical protein [Polycladospora coralii]MBS7529298.1 hypothetical protein [Polycladospora coralii]
MALDAYAYIYSNSNQTLSVGEAITFNMIGKLNNIAFTPSSSVITINDGGDYLIKYIVSTNAQLNANQTFDSRFTIRISGSDQTPESVYFNETTNFSSNTNSIIEQVSGQMISNISDGSTIQLISSSGGNITASPAFGSGVSASIIIMKLS